MLRTGEYGMGNARGLKTGCLLIGALAICLGWSVYQGIATSIFFCFVCAILAAVAFKRKNWRIAVPLTACAALSIAAIPVIVIKNQESGRAAEAKAAQEEAAYLEQKRQQQALAAEAAAASEQGMRALEDGNHSEAAELLGKAIKGDPQNAELIAARRQALEGVRAERIAQLETEAKALPASEFRRLFQTYSTLSGLDPENKDYAYRREKYGERVKEDDERLEYARRLKDSDIHLVKFTSSFSNGWAHVQGAVKNNSTRTLENVQVEVVFADPGGNFLEMETFRIDKERLLPTEYSEFAQVVKVGTPLHIAGASIVGYSWVAVK